MTTNHQTTRNPQPTTHNLGTRDYWIAELHRFREMWSTQEFWQDPKRATRALGALVWVWLNTKDQKPHDASTMEATCEEFQLRLSYAAALVQPTAPSK